MTPTHANPPDPLEPHGSGSARYVAMAIHRDEAARQAHETMGFHEGWGAALDQLVAVARTMPASSKA